MEGEVIQIMETWTSYIHQARKIAPSSQIKKEMLRHLRMWETITALCRDTDRRQVKEAAERLWLRRLDQIAYVTDDALDELLYKIMIPLQRQTDTRRNNTASFPSNSSVIGNKLSCEIKRINQMINEIFSVRDRYGLQFSGADHLLDTTSSREQLNRLNAMSCVDESSVFGREDDARKIKDMLLDIISSSSSVNLNPYKETPAIIPIVGFVGVGKTTLAQLVYNDERVRQHFEHTMWVCVLDEFDIFSILRKVLESIAGNECQQHQNLDALVCKFHEYLNGKKYLLVLDDVRVDDFEEWEKLKILLQIDDVHQQRSKILVTTPSDKVASMVGGSIPPYRLQRLSEEECWSIIKNKAFSPGGAMQTPKMLQIGRDAARLCCGLPLIARRLGAFLHSKKDETSWLALRHGDFASVYSPILPQMMFMYDDFPLHLKKLFSYFSMFPQDQMIQRDFLIRFWMAEGFIKLSDETNEMSMEDIGKQYFNNLLGSLYFKDGDLEKDEYGYLKSIRLDEVTHQLSREVAEDCGILKVSQMGKITDQVRRLRLVCDEDLNLISTPNNLRTLVGIQRLYSKQIAKVFSNKHLRVLELRNCTVATLPDLSKLIHLRYLDLSDCQDLLLGQSISSLWYLQTLVLRGCGSLTELTWDIGSLKNLRYLDLSYTGIMVLPESSTSLQSLLELNLSNSHLQRLPTDFGALEQLRHLDISFTNIRMLPASLTNLSQLRTFKFNSCHYLEALPSDFGRLIHLKCLDLSSTRIKELHEPSIYKGLCNLETLILAQCKLPVYIGDLKSLKHLVYEGNETARGIKELTCLQTLQQYVLKDDNKSEGGIGDIEGLNFLKEVKFCNLQNVKDWKGAERANLKGKQHIHCLDLHWSIRYFHSGYLYTDGEVLNALQPHANLKILRMKNFMGSKLPPWIGDSVSSYLPNLVELVFSGCSRCEQLPALGQLQYLRILSLHGMNSVKFLGKEFYGREGSSSRNGTPTIFPSLVELTFDSMKSLKRWDAPPSTLPAFPLLEKMTISRCSQLKAVRTPFPSLKELRLQSCHLLVRLHDIQCLESLQKLSVEDCKSLKYSPDDLKFLFATALLEVDTPISPF